MSRAVLFGYWRSSASYRVRVALHLAEIAFDEVAVDLSRDAHRQPEHLDRNPQGLVPVLDIDGLRLTQSLAIIEYLDETRHLGLLPTDPAQRARVRAAAMSIAIEIQPVCNLSVSNHATGGLEPARSAWFRHFMEPGLRATEALLAGFDQTPYACGAAVTLTDLCLIPQLYNADRWGADYSDCPRILAAQGACLIHPAFAASHPDRPRPA